MRISGKFTVNLQPLEAYAKGEGGIKLGRMSIDKTFYGDLTASSKGEMLSVMTAVEGSAGYVAIEQVTGILDGKEGGFRRSAVTWSECVRSTSGGHTPTQFGRHLGRTQARAFPKSGECF